ncbi:hypothetical protein UB33_10465 [Photobacterium angustum]|nr:hypothetical protein UB33_10465 [Photobacterium angustum]PSV88543.1 hypothetical protein CTN01_20025 [Photobacterium angustum]
MDYLLGLITLLLYILTLRRLGANNKETIFFIIIYSLQWLYVINNSEAINISIHLLSLPLLYVILKDIKEYSPQKAVIGAFSVITFLLYLKVI